MNPLRVHTALVKHEKKLHFSRKMLLHLIFSRTPSAHFPEIVV